MPRERSKYKKNHEYDGKNLTITEWSHETGIRCSVIYKRLYRGWTFGQAIDIEAPPDKGKEAKKYEHNGKSLTLRQWAEEYGINYNSLREKINKGYSINQAIRFGIARKSRKNSCKDFNGKEWTIKEISEYTGLPAPRLYDYGHKIALKKYEWNNQMRTLDQWEKELGIPHKILYGLLESGLSFDQIIERFRHNAKPFSKTEKNNHDEQPAS